ncbi:hypothetical protein FS837_011180 [Tulasnella sp. UAMH 9824]|nr:hypothetical protein FS837_011180 [Tulasnella sp. UAMH 9824]
MTLICTENWPTWMWRPVLRRQAQLCSPLAPLPQREPHVNLYNRRRALSNPRRPSDAVPEYFDVIFNINNVLSRDPRPLTATNQQETIRTVTFTLDLQCGLEVYKNNAADSWWRASHSNRNYISNGGLMMGGPHLANHTTSTTARILNYTLLNAVATWASFLVGATGSVQPCEPTPPNPGASSNATLTVTGAYWNGLALDNYFDDASDG